jgi:hypothetical protein
MNLHGTALACRKMRYTFSPMSGIGANGAASSGHTRAVSLTIRGQVYICIERELCRRAGAKATPKENVFS